MKEHKKEGMGVKKLPFFVKHYNFLFYSFFEFVSVVVTSFISSGLIQISLVLIVFVWYTKLTHKHQKKFYFFVDRIQYRLRMLQSIFMILFMVVVTLVSFVAEFRYGNVLTKGEIAVSISVMIVSMTLAVIIEVTLLLLNFSNEVKEMVNERKMQKKMAKIRASRKKAKKEVEQ